MVQCSYFCANIDDVQCNAFEFHGPSEDGCRLGTVTLDEEFNAVENKIKVFMISGRYCLICLYDFLIEWIIYR